MSGHELEPTPGFTIIPDWIIEINVNGGDLSVNALVVYMVLTKYASAKTRTSFPSRATIGKHLNKSPDTVDRAIVELLEAGLITKEERHAEGGMQTSNVYTILYTHTAPVPTPQPHPCGTGGRTDAAPGAAPVRQELDVEELDVEEPEKRARKARAPRAVRKAMPEGWRPSEQTIAKMRDRYPALDLEVEVEHLRDWTQAGSYKYADWDAAFRNHCRSQATRNAPKVKTDHKGRTVDEQGRMVNAHGRFR